MCKMRNINGAIYFYRKYNLNKKITSKAFNPVEIKKKKKKKKTSQHKILPGHVSSRLRKNKKRKHSRKETRFAF